MESQQQKKNERRQCETELDSIENCRKSKKMKRMKHKNGRNIKGSVDEENVRSTSSVDSELDSLHLCTERAELHSLLSPSSGHSHTHEEENLREEFYCEKHGKKKKRKRKRKIQDVGGEMSVTKNEEEEAHSNGDVSVVLDSSSAPMKKKRKRKYEEKETTQKENKNFCEVVIENKKRKQKKHKKEKRKQYADVLRKNKTFNGDSLSEGLPQDQTSNQHVEPDRQKAGKTKSKNSRKSKEKVDTSGDGTDDRSFTDRVMKEPKKRKSIEATSHKCLDVVSGKKKQDNTMTKQHSQLLLHSSWALNKELENKLKKEGFGVLSGRWSKAEEDTLRTNMKDILKSYDISDVRMLVFPQEIEDGNKRKEVKELTISSDLYRKLGKGINRSLFNVYRKVKRIFDEKNYLGSFSDEEKEELIRLHNLHGNNWVKIGQIMGRSNLAVNHEFVRLKGDRGKWKEEEKKRLREAVNLMTSSMGGAQSTLQWNEIAKIVGTRNGEQCRKQWLHCLCWKDYGNPAVKWNKADDLQLIERLCQSTATQECEIDWEELAKGWDKVPSPNWLRNKWATLKREQVHSKLYMEFDELVDHVSCTYGEKLRRLVRADQTLH